MPFLAVNTASSSDFSCWPLATAGSLPPCALEASSIEYSFATALKSSPLSMRGLGLVGLGLGLRQDDAQVAPLGLGEALLVLVVVLLDVLVGDLRGALRDLLGELLLKLVELDAEEDVLLAHAGGLEELLVGLVGRERGLLLVGERALDLGVGDLDVLLLGLLLDPLGLDQELHDLALERVVLRLALLLERGGGGLLRAPSARASSPWRPRTS